MKRYSITRRAVSGFSLLEVLIAVVVLATGLLALAALQATLARNSADAKVRSRMAALLSNELDEVRSAGYDTVGGTATTTTNAGTDCTVANPDSVTAAGCEAAVNGLTLTRTVTEFSASGGAFAKGAPASPRDAQFKHVVVEASWTDATGATRSIAQSTVLSALALQANSPLVNTDPGGFSPQSPKVRQENPFEEGMIPIAIGDGSETAATNPKPVVVGTNNTVTETKFNVLTYQNQGADGTLIQQRIETTVIGCRCAYGNQGQLEGVFTQNFRPTYWDGSRYAPPEMLDATRPATAGPANIDPSVNPQSDLCTDCCRDHHDQADDTIKFDPHRKDAHNHYLRSGTTFTLATSGEYNESCRVVRVSGLWRVASDFKVEHVGYVATGPAPANQAPDPEYAEHYETFVVDSLRDRFVSTIKDGKSMSQRYDEPIRLLNDAPLGVLENAPGVSSPPGTAPASSDDVIQMDADPADWRYLHSRALLIDNIEPEAQQEIDNAIADCNKTGDAVVECALPHIPFTTINITELARYATNDPDVISVVDGGTNFNDPLIAQGLVSGRTTADPDDTDTLDFASADVTFRLSNSALAATQPIEPPANDSDEGDAKVWLPDPTVTLPAPHSSDMQLYQPINVLKGLVGEDFFVELFATGMAPLTDGTQSNDPGVRWKIGDSYRYPCGATTDDTGPIPALCQTDSSLGPLVALDLTVSGYNYWADSEDETVLTCPNANNNGDYGTVTRKAYAKGELCRRYEVTSAAVNGAGGRGASLIEVTAFPGSAATGATEETTISFNGDDGHHVKPGETVDVVFGHVEDVEPELALCHYKNLNATPVASADWTSDCGEK